MAERERPTLRASTTLTTRSAHKSGGEARAEALRRTAAEVDPSPDDFAIVPAKAGDVRATDQAPGKRAKARGQRAQVGFGTPRF